MDDLYREDEYCMNFTNEEIIEYLVAKAKGYDGVILKLLSANGESLSSISQDEIKFVCFDGDEQSFYISFNKHLTAFFFLNQEFMFIDDMAKEYQTREAVGRFSCFIYLSI